METFKRVINTKNRNKCSVLIAQGIAFRPALGRSLWEMVLPSGNTVPILQYIFKALCIPLPSPFESQLIFCSGFPLSFF